MAQVMFSIMAHVTIKATQEVRVRSTYCCMSYAYNEDTLREYMSVGTQLWEQHHTNLHNSGEHPDT